MDNLFEIWALNYFGGHLQMFNFPEIVPRNVSDCGSRDHEGELCVIIFLDIRVWEGDTASEVKNFSEILVLKLRV